MLVINLGVGIVLLMSDSENFNFQKYVILVDHPLKFLIRFFVQIIGKLKFSESDINQIIPTIQEI